MRISDVHELLDQIYDSIDPEAFIASDPIQVPHQFTRKEDIEIAGFFSAIIAWGQRSTIISNSNKLVEWMGGEPYDFIMHHSDDDLRPFANFVHRTFNGTDCLYFIHALHNIYSSGQSLEDLFVGFSMKERISNFHKQFLSIDPVPRRTYKHIANPDRNSSAKRLNMYLRWMVRSDGKGIDFGIWNSITQADLHCPLDVHVQRAAMNLGLLHRKQQDWKAVEELQLALKAMDPMDPSKFDYGLFLYGQRLEN